MDQMVSRLNSVWPQVMSFIKKKKGAYKGGSTVLQASPD